MNDERQGDLQRRHEQLMGRTAPLLFDEPLELAAGHGVWLIDTDGQRFLDLYNNVPCVGHANPHVGDAVARQVATLNVHSRYLHENVIAYGERLMALHHDGIESMIMTCTGSEAVELAIRIARTATGRSGLICTDATYHGNTSLVGRTRRLATGEGQGDIRSISTPGTFRPLQEGLNEQQLLQLHLDELAQTIESFNDSGGFAGLLVCSILANEGLPVPPAGWFEQVCAMVHEAGGLVIADEIQAGFGRSGQWWGYQTNNFTPDITTMGKPMGNGMPVSAVAASNELITQFRGANPYFNTFASSPLQAAAANAVLDEIENRELLRSVTEIGERIRRELRVFQESTPEMGDVRGEGLYIGIDWVEPGTTIPDAAGAVRFVEALKSKHIHVGHAGHHWNVVKIRPPIVIEHEHVDLLLEAMTEILG